MEQEVEVYTQLLAPNVATPINLASNHTQVRDRQGTRTANRLHNIIHVQEHVP
jgi:hypothetical protein